MRRTNWRHFDFWLLGAVAVLTIVGVTMIRSAVAGNIELAELDLVRRQLIFAGVGFVVMIVIAAIDYRLWASLNRTLYYGMAVVLAVLFITGAVLFGSARWFDTGVILIQPSEFAKLVMVLVLADFFTRIKELVGQLSTVGRSLLLTMGIVIWILLQPNLSTSIVIIVIW
ncbi:MAG: FtsW/RodA/SpoVE family cell cycle protein, partial [Anaerolineales bacterium]|nr:FtsW/RodA/SpoVE family cell cycle protein [Anaerolineales bacterium]